VKFQRQEGSNTRARGPSSALVREEGSRYFARSAEDFKPIIRIEAPDIGCSSLLYARLR
jgi:hypothetical protein